MQPQRTVIAYHLILTCYGFWLPNDPRGSGSTEVWADALRPFGPATKVATDRSVAARPHDRTHRLTAKCALKRRPVRFTGRQAQCVARGFRHYFAAKHLHCLACAVMPNHAHLVIERGDLSVERMSVGLKAASVHALLETGLHPYQQFPEERRPKVWARGDRHPFLFDAADLVRAIDYVVENPVKCGLRPQRWSFVTGQPRTK